MSRARAFRGLRTSPTLHPLLLVLALLLAQAGAVTHRYSHLQPEGGPAGSQQQPLCTECLSSAPLLSAAGGSDGAVVVRRATASVRVCGELVSLIESVHHYAFRSRAPPRLFR